MTHMWWKIIVVTLLTIGAPGFLCHAKTDSASPPASVQNALAFTLSADGLPPGGMWKSTPALLDIHKDGKMAIAVHPRLGEGPRIFVSDAAGKWTDASGGLSFGSASCGGGLAFGDINKNGQIDLAVADHCKGIYVYKGDGKGGWETVVRAMQPEIGTPKPGQKEDDDSQMTFKGAEDLALGDVNEDGFLDMVVAAADEGGLTLYLGDGAFGWKESRPTGLPTAQNPEPGDEVNAGWANQIRLADVNKDGHLDVIASYYKGPAVWLGDGKGSFKAASEGLPRPSMGGLYRGLAYGDINKDGLTDLAFANEVNGAEVYLQQGDGTWQPMPDAFPEMKGGAVALALADITGDGDLDLIVAGRKNKDIGNSYGLYVLEGDGKGGFREIATDLPQAGLSITWGVEVADLNGNGLLDIVLTTGGVVPGFEKGRLIRKPGPDQPEPIPELPFPRVQVWLNKSGK